MERRHVPNRATMRRRGSLTLGGLLLSGVGPGRPSLRRCRGSFPSSAARPSPRRDRPGPDFFRKALNSTRTTPRRSRALSRQAGVVRVALQVPAPGLRAMRRPPAGPDPEASRPARPRRAAGGRPPHRPPATDPPPPSRRPADPAAPPAVEDPCRPTRRPARRPLRSRTHPPARGPGDPGERGRTRERAAAGAHQRRPPARPTRPRPGRPGQPEAAINTSAWHNGRPIGRSGVRRGQDVPDRELQTHIFERGP